MNCFVHNEVSAVGICKHCNKALCGSCAVDTGEGLACSGECESRVAEYAELLDRNLRILGVGLHKSAIPSSSVLFPLILSVIAWSVTIYAFVTREVTVGVIVPTIVVTIWTCIAYYGLSPNRRIQHLGLRLVLCVNLRPYTPRLG